MWSFSLLLREAGITAAGHTEAPQAAYVEEGALKPGKPWETTIAGNPGIRTPWWLSSRYLHA
jgi:hypothetical protein